MAALAIDPFDSNHAVYATGATVYATHDFSEVSRDQPTKWAPWVTGIEQTAIITLCSPPAGPPLLSGFGDINGFVHENLEQSPPQGFYQPPLGSNLVIDYAANAPNVLVRSGEGEEGGPPAAVSDDSGKTWQTLAPPTGGNGGGLRGRRPPTAIAVSADGKTIVLSAGSAMLTNDRGATWTVVNGLPRGARPIADRVNAARFYAMDFGSGKILASVDGGRDFSVIKSSR